MPRNVLISFRDWMQDAAATISGGVWVQSIENIKDSRPQFVAEAASNVDWTSTTFDVDLGYTRRVGVIGFLNLRTSPMGLISIKAGIDPTFATNLYSTLVSSWPEDGTAEFEYNAWGEFSLTHTYMREEYTRLGFPRFFVLGATVQEIRYIRVQIMDSTCSEPIQIGNFGVFETWEPSTLLPMGWQVSMFDESALERVPMGSTYIDSRGMRRRLSFGFQVLSHDEIWTQGFGLVLVKGKSQPLMAMPLPDNTYELEKQTVWGLISQDSVLGNPFFQHYSLTFQIDQLI